jgi:hypothetical protein
MLTGTYPSSACDIHIDNGYIMYYRGLALMGVISVCGNNECLAVNSNSTHVHLTLFP